MITAKFLGPKHQELKLGFQGRLYLFKGQEAIEVAPELAEYCQSLIDRRRKSIFEVKGTAEQVDPGLDIQELLGVQLEFDNWALIHGNKRYGNNSSDGHAPNDR